MAIKIGSAMDPNWYFILLSNAFLSARLMNLNFVDCFYTPCKQRSPGGIALDKLISGYQAVYGNQLEEDALFNKCTDAITFFEKVDKEIEGNYRLGMNFILCSLLFIHVLICSLYSWRNNLIPSIDCECFICF